MGRVFITGDKHGNFSFLEDFCYENNTTTEDTLIILGDAGINYFLKKIDEEIKKEIAKYPITLFCIHGNHEERPQNIPTYKLKYFSEYGCNCWYEEKFPTILFPENGIAEIKGNKCLIIGGAYSIDKYYRLVNHYSWFESEQLTEEEKNEIFSSLEENDSFDYIFTHTAPLNYEPTYLFLKFIDQSQVDKSMEIFLQKVYDKVRFKKWYFGHYHDNKDFENGLSILFNSIIEIM